MSPTEPVPQPIKPKIVLAPKLDPPTESEIETTLNLIQDILEGKKIDRYENRAAKEGYKEAENILVDDRRTYAGIEELKTVQGRAIACLAVDYLNGECSRKTLVKVPLK